MTDFAPTLSDYGSQDTALAEREAQVWIEVGGVGANWLQTRPFAVID